MKRVRSSSTEYMIQGWVGERQPIDGHGTQEILEDTKILESNHIPCCITGVSALVYYGPSRVERSVFLSFQYRRVNLILGLEDLCANGATPSGKLYSQSKRLHKSGIAGNLLLPVTYISALEMRRCLPFLLSGFVALLPP